MKRFLAAIRFLTILPIPGTWGTAEADLVACVPFFPLVGLLLGFLAGGAAWLLAPFCPPMVLAALMIVLLLSFSGGLHMDGLSDSADAFLSSRSRQRMLEIMKDSHVGAMGVIAIACVLLLKFAALASLPTSRLWQTLLLMPVAGRCAVVVNMALLPSARPGGLGALLSQRRARLAAVFSLAVMFAVGSALRAPGLITAAAVALLALLFAAYCRRKIGGSTGDTFGAVCELAETIVPFVLCLLPA